jgi:hypothetical protein
LLCFSCYLVTHNYIASLLFLFTATHCHNTILNTMFCPLFVYYFVGGLFSFTRQNNTFSVSNKTAGKFFPISAFWGLQTRTNKQTMLHSPRKTNLVHSIHFTCHECGKSKMRYSGGQMQALKIKLHFPVRNCEVSFTTHHITHTHTTDTHTYTLQTHRHTHTLQTHTHTDTRTHTLIHTLCHLNTMLSKHTSV